MRTLLLLLIAGLLASCATEYAPEESMNDPAYAMGSVAVAAQPDTLPLPDAGYNDSIFTSGSTGSAPTPYGLTIQQGEAYTGSKGATSPGASTSPASAPQRLLTGRWVNADDPEEMVALTPTHYVTYYGGEELVEEDMTFYNVCPSACSGGTSTGKPCFTISGPAQTDCYGIVDLSDDILELQLLGVSNETIVYRRAD